MKHNYVYAYPSVHGTCNIVNYFSSDRTNEFLHLFDVWGSYGKRIFHNHDKNTFIETWFECSKEFYDMLHTETMKRAFKHMGVELVFEYPFMEEFNSEKI